jgi:hypothetical protein
VTCCFLIALLCLAMSDGEKPAKATVAVGAIPSALILLAAFL